MCNKNFIFVLKALLTQIIFMSFVYSICEDDYDCCEQDNRSKVDYHSRMNFNDDFDLRYRNPNAHQLSYDDEILYMIAKPSSNNNLPFGYMTTGCIVMSRADRHRYRITMLNFFQHNDFVKTTMDKFNVIGKYITSI